MSNTENIYYYIYYSIPATAQAKAPDLPSSATRRA
jgi:hypothetical protein